MERPIVVAAQDSVPVYVEPSVARDNPPAKKIWIIRIAYYKIRLPIHSATLHHECDLDGTAVLSDQLRDREIG